jgi:hypothetical protein
MTCPCGAPAHVHTPAGRMCWYHYLQWCDVRRSAWAQRAELEREANSVIEHMATHVLMMQGAKGGDE